MRDRFLFRREYLDAIEQLPDGEQLAAYDAICRYALFDEIPDGGSGARVLGQFAKRIDLSNALMIKEDRRRDAGRGAE